MSTTRKNPVSMAGDFKFFAASKRHLLATWTLTGRRVLGAILCPLLVSAASGQEEEVPDAPRLLERLEAHTGTAEARSAIKSLRIRGHVVAPEMTGKATLEETYLGEARARMNVVFGPMGTMATGITETYSWSDDPVMGVAITEGKEQGAERRYFQILRRLPWKTMYERARAVGFVTLEGRRLVELHMAKATGKPDRWFVDPEGPVLAAIDIEFPDMQGGKLSANISFSDWRRIEGVLFPFKRQFKSGSMKADFVYDELVINESVEEKDVEQPEKVTKALMDRTLRARTTPPKAGDYEVKTLAAVHVASIRTTIDEAKISQNLAVILPEVAKYLGSIGEVPTGPPFSRYHAREGGRVELEAGIPVKRSIEGSGRIKASSLPAGRAAVTWHIGPYHDLAKTYGVLEKWMTAQGHESNGAFWETYWTDPGLEPDPAKWKTEIAWPIK